MFLIWFIFLLKSFDKNISFTYVLVILLLVLVSNNTINQIFMSEIFNLSFWYISIYFMSPKHFEAAVVNIFNSVVTTDKLVTEHWSTDTIFLFLE